jgi:hypothetical protein
MFFFTQLSNTFIACYLLMIIHCKYDIVFVYFITKFPLRFLYYKAWSWSMGFLQVLNI